MFTDRLTFYGQGSMEPAVGDQEMIVNFIGNLTSGLAAPPQAIDGDPAGQAGESGIQGTVLIGPACPGPQRAEQPCPDEPYQARLTILDQSNQVVAEVQTEADGQFRLKLPPGTYTIQPEPGNPLPQASDLSVMVADGTYTTVQILYDSGIR
jgi:hypothetical protein